MTFKLTSSKHPHIFKHKSKNMKKCAQDWLNEYNYMKVTLAGVFGPIMKNISFNSRLDNLAKKNKKLRRSQKNNCKKQLNLKK